MILAALVWGCMAGSAHADVVHLKNGRTLQGTTADAGENRIRVTLPGGSLLIDRAEVVRVELSSAATVVRGPHLDLRSEQLRALGLALRAAFHQRDALMAERLLDSNPRAKSIHDLRGAADVRCTVATTRKGMQVSVRLRRKTSAQAPLLIAIPPGTQVGKDMVLLRAAAIVLDAKRPEITLTLPVATTRALTDPPQRGKNLPLTRVGDGALTSLLTLLCAGDQPPAEAAAQLALWILHSDVTPDALVSQGPHLTLGSRQLILPLHGPSAARLLEAAGLAWQRQRFFRPRPLPALPQRGESSL